MRNKWHLALVAVLALSMIGCKGKANEQSGAVALQVGDAKITADDINTYLKSMNDMQRAMFAQNPEAKKNLVKQFEQMFLLGEKGRKDGMMDSADFKFQQRLAEEQIMANMIVKKEIMDGVKVSDEDAKKYYDEHQTEFKAEKLWAHHILVKDKADADAIYKQLKAAPGKFEAIAKAKSIDPGSKTNGGDLGEFERGRMVPQFEEAAFALKPGEISKPVQSQFGWHIIRLDKREASSKSFEEVKEQIKNQMLGTKREEAFNKMIEGLKKEFPVKQDDAVIDKEVGKDLAPPAMPQGHPGMPPTPPPPPAPTPGK